MSFTVRPLREDKQSRVSLKSVLSAASRLYGPLLMLARLWQERQEERQKSHERMNMLKRIIVILVAVLCAVLLFAGTAKALISLKLLSMDSVVRTVSVDLPSDQYGHTNILLLGQGDADHDGIDLTDTVMIASIDPKNTKSVALLSLPRDLYFLSTDKMGKGRINSLYRDYKGYLQGEGFDEKEASRTAMRELGDEIGRALGMDIHHIVKVDFIGFVQAVDAIGGIDIVVPETLVDTEYPGPDYTYETFSIEAGPQHIDGETALKYARSRHSTSDFDRARRQQQIVKAVGDKVREDGTLTSPRQIMALLNILQEHVETTLEVREMAGLAKTGKEIDSDRILSMQLNTDNGLYGSLSEPGGLLYNPPRDQFGGASVLLPVSIPEFPVTWNQIRSFVFLLVHERESHLEKTPIQIFNAGAAEGSARKLGGELYRYGFNVVAMENRKGNPSALSSVSGGGDNVTARHLSQILNMQLETQDMPPSSDGTQLPPMPISIVLGEDYVFSPIQDSILSSDEP